MDQEFLEKVLEAHEKWAQGSPNGEWADLSREDLYEACMQAFDLRFIDLNGADLRDAKLSGSNLSNAQMRNADLRGASISDANLTNANLNGADLRNAYLVRSNLTGATLIGVDLTGADLRFANLTKANLTRANLSKADLSYADLSQADTTDAIFSDTCLVKTNFDVQYKYDMEQCVEFGNRLYEVFDRKIYDGKKFYSLEKHGSPGIHEFVSEGFLSPALDIHQYKICPSCLFYVREELFGTHGLCQKCEGRYVHCEGCGREFDTRYMPHEEWEGKMYCRHCCRDLLIQCEECGQYFPKDTLRYEYHGKSFCSFECRDNYAEERYQWLLSRDTVLENK